MYYGFYFFLEPNYLDKIIESRSNIQLYFIFQRID